MKSPETSPRPMVKVTYLERQKKNASEANDHTESSSSDVKTSSPKARGSSSRKETMNQEGKQVDNFRVPDPPLRRAGEQVLDSVKQKALPHTSKDKKLERHARSSSISSLSHVVQQMAASPSNKPPSLVGKTEPQVRSNTPETEFDDDASIAESAISISRIRRSEIERIQYFENQPDCDKIEPHRAFCTRCCKYVSLGTKQTYTVRPWEKHRSRCDQKPPRPTETADGSSVAIDKPTRRTEAERKAFLESDERAEVVEPDQVKCKKCQKWVRIFAPTVKYNLQNWNKHQLSCSGSIPSDRVAAAERKLRIVNDAQAKSFESDSVDCNLCGERVMLEGEGEYNLTKWDEHKARCVSANDNTEAKSDLPLVLASSGTKSTEINDTHSVSGTNNLKREREEDGEATDVTDVRPSTRPRNVSYEPPNNEAPGPFGWFMLPFKAFARGFRESLGGEPSS